MASYVIHSNLLPYLSITSGFQIWYIVNTSSVLWDHKFCQIIVLFMLDSIKNNSYKTTIKQYCPQNTMICKTQEYGFL